MLFRYVSRRGYIEIEHSPSEELVLLREWLQTEGHLTESHIKTDYTLAGVYAHAILQEMGLDLPAPNASCSSRDVAYTFESEEPWEVYRDQSILRDDLEYKFGHRVWFRRMYKVAVGPTELREYQKTLYKLHMKLDSFYENGDPGLTKLQRAIGICTTNLHVLAGVGGVMDALDQDKREHLMNEYAIIKCQLEDYMRMEQDRPPDPEHLAFLDEINRSGCNTTREQSQEGAQWDVETKSFMSRAETRGFVDRTHELRPIPSMNETSSLYGGHRGGVRLVEIELDKFIASSGFDDIDMVRTNLRMARDAYPKQVNRLEEQYTKLRARLASRAIAVVRVHSARVTYCRTREPGLYAGIYDILLKKYKIEELLRLTSLHLPGNPQVTGCQNIREELSQMCMLISILNKRTFTETESVAGILGVLRADYVKWLKKGDLALNVMEFMHEVYLFRNYSRMVCPTSGFDAEFRAMYRQASAKFGPPNQPTQFSREIWPSEEDIVRMSPERLSHLRVDATWRVPYPGLPEELRTKISILETLNRLPVTVPVIQVAQLMIGFFEGYHAETKKMRVRIDGTTIIAEDVDLLVEDVLSHNVLIVRTATGEYVVPRVHGNRSRVYLTLRLASGTILEPSIGLSDIEMIESSLGVHGGYLYVRDEIVTCQTLPLRVKS